MRVVASILVLAFVAGTVPAQERAKEDEGLAYQRRQGRQEGLRRPKKGEPDMELISFIGGERIEKGATKLRVRFFMPATGKAATGKAFVTARELVPRRNYFMRVDRTEWRSGWNVFAQWPARDVLVPASIQTNQLGVLVRRDHERAGSAKVAPALVQDSKAPISQYTMHFRVRAELTGMQYRRHRGNKTDWIPVRRRIRANTTIPIRLEFKDDEPEGTYHVDIQYTVGDRKGATYRRYTFHHKPTPGG